MLSEPVAGTLDLNDDSMVKQSVEQRNGDDGITEHFWMPQPLTDESLRYG